MKKTSVIAFASALAAACGEEPKRVKFTGPADTSASGSADLEDGSLGLCSSSSSGDSLTCTGGQSVVLPPTFPHSKDCNKCITTVTAGVVKVKCPNGLTFEFQSVKGDKGDVGAKGDSGSSCSVTTDGWVKCTDGSSYKLLQGPKGDKGDVGAPGAPGRDGKDGVGCTLGENSAGQTTITCGDKTTVVSGCGGGGCWSYGTRGNVYRLPVNTSTLPDFTPMTPVASAVADRFDVASRQSSQGMPYTYTPSFTDTEWYGIVFSGFVEVDPAPGDRVCFKLTSDDGARFSLGLSNVEVIAMPGLQSPTAKTGCILAASGWHQYKLEWFQGPRTQIALQLEVSYDNGTTYKIINKDQFKFEIK